MLTLKILSGFSDKEIANALLMKESAVRKEIYRAKEILKSRYSSLGIPYLPQVYERIDTVLTIVYLMFNEGYKTTNSDEVINEELCYESVRITYLILQTNYTDKGKIYALLSLMYFNLARYSSRVNDNGELINLEFQDRSKWDKAQIIKGFFYLKKSRESKEFSRYHLESTIASFHCSAPTFEKTDWKGILDCYKKLLEKEDSIIVNLNYAIALGWAEGFEIGLNALKEIVPDSKYNRSFYLNVAIAEMNFQLTRYEIAKSYYQVALDQTLSMVDKTFIIEKIMNCDKKNFSSN